MASRYQMMPYHTLVERVKREDSPLYYELQLLLHYRPLAVVYQAFQPNIPALGLPTRYPLFASLPTANLLSHPPHLLDHAHHLLHEQRFTIVILLCFNLTSIANSLFCLFNFMYTALRHILSYLYCLKWRKQYTIHLCQCHYPDFS